MVTIQLVLGLDQGYMVMVCVQDKGQGYNSIGTCVSVQLGLVLGFNQSLGLISRLGFRFNQTLGLGLEFIYGYDYVQGKLWLMLMLRLGLIFSIIYQV